MTLRLVSPFLLACVISTSYAQRGDFTHYDFVRADSIASRWHGYDLTKRKKLVYNLVEDLTTDVEKFRAIFRWVTDNIEYDYDLYLEWKAAENRFKYDRKKRMRWNERFSERTYARTVIKKKAVCMGYARILDEMCADAGIPSRTIGRICEIDKE